MVFGCALIFVGLVPLYKYFFVAPDLQGSRYLYFSAFGWAILLSIVLLQVIKRKIGYISLALMITLLFGFTLHYNLMPWKKAGQIIEALPDEIEEENIPDNYYGAYILRNSYKEYRIIKKRIGK
jgi:hypothetical protein